MNRLISKYFTPKKQFQFPINNNKNKIYETKNYQYQAFPLLALLRTSVMICGRLLNRRWRKLSDIEKAKFKMKYSKWFSLGILIAGGTTSIGYYSFSEISEINGRRRFMIIGTESLNEILGDSYKQLLSPDTLVFSNNHPQYKFIKKMVDTIVLKNKEVYPTLNREWTVIISDDDSMINASCLPTGHVIVFTGLINFVENPHQLAAVISHEMSHVLLEHGRESISRVSLLSSAMLCIGFGLWTFIPNDFMALFSNWLKNRLVKVFMELPYNRRLEAEADYLGLKLMARSCFDIEEAPRFWEIMDAYEKRTGSFIPDWLSTHPSSLLRAQYLADNMDEARKIKVDSGCFHSSLFLSDIARQLAIFGVK